jgi:hypothetical protein
MFDTSGDGTHAACGSKSRKADEEADADMKATGAVEGVVDALDALHPRCEVAAGFGGVGVAMLLGMDGGGCVAARFAADLPERGAGKARG